MFSKIRSAVLSGLDAKEVAVETDISSGLPAFSVVGQAGTSIREAKERIRSAVTNSGMKYPQGRITVNIAPADMRKHGSHLDLAMALGLLAASGALFELDIENYCILGELALDGAVRHVKGVLPIVMAMERQGITKVMLPACDIGEASLVRGVELYPVNALAQAEEHFNRKKVITPIKDILPSIITESMSYGSYDYSEVKGQEYAKRAMAIAAAGGHGILMTGSPATGKTMLAERITTILPEMTYDEMLDTTVIYSAAGKLDADIPVITKRPFRRPHHKITVSGLIGGKYPLRPGEISYAHNGVLFLDEAGEFGAGVIDSLRVPLEEKKITLTRGGETVVYPADFLLVAATNPCRCGNYGDPVRACTCTAGDIAKYRARISGPVLDRIDIHLRLIPVKYGELTGGRLEAYGSGEGNPTAEKNHGSGMDSNRAVCTDSAELRELVVKAREIQRKRFMGSPTICNAGMTDKEVEKYACVGAEAGELLGSAYESMGLDPRQLQKTKKIARTIADMEGEAEISTGHIAEALSYRERRLG